METIKVSKRDFSKKAKRLRAEGFIPGSVFGGALAESIPLQINEAAAKKSLMKIREGSRVKLDLEGRSIPAQVKEISLNSITGKYQAIDFQALKADQKVKSVAHIVLQNANKVTAILEHMVTEIPYSAFPADMIDTVDIDVDGMPVGTVVTIGDIKELHNGKIDLHIDDDEIVLRIVEAKVSSEEEEEAPAEE